MRASHLTWRGCLLTGLLLSAAHAQSSTTQPLPGLTDEQSAQLERYRSIITNPADSEGTRQSQAEACLLTGWPAATDLLIELLETSAEPSTRVVIGRAIGRVQSSHPELVDLRLVEPLARLVAAGSPAVSEASTRALSTFRDSYVYRHLGAVAQDAARPLAQRLGIIEALAPNVDERAVIEQLIGLLGVEETAVRDRAIAALVRASRTNYGPRVEAWIAWWQEKSSLTEDAWLLDRVALFSERARDLEQRLDTLQRESEARYRALARRLADVLRLTYRLTAQQAQKDELVTSWLRDPLIEFRRSALDLVREQIYDQELPSDAVRAALRERYADPSTELRREVLELVGALNDPQDLEPILARLTVETELSVRETIVAVLGKLRNPAAIPVLIKEIANHASPSACVGQAAESLATLARNGEDPAQFEDAVGPLESALTSTDPANVSQRAALLGAMASIGSAAFADEFVAHLDEEYPELLLAAIRGVVAVDDAGQVNRLRMLLLHADPRVRRQAVEAIGALGNGAGSLEALINHLNSASESNEAVRTAAWDAFRRILNRQPAGARLEWAGRLKDQPARQIEYLTLLVEDFTSANPQPVQLNGARALLAQVLRGQGRYAESVRHLQELYAVLSNAGDAEAERHALLLLDSMLRSGQSGDRFDPLLAELASGTEAARAEAVNTIRTYLDEAVGDPANVELAARVERLRSACAGRYGKPFDEYLADLSRRLATQGGGGPSSQP